MWRMFKRCWCDGVRAWNSAGPCLNDDVQKCDVRLCYRGRSDIRTRSVAVKVAFVRASAIEDVRTFERLRLLCVDPILTTENIRIMF